MPSPISILFMICLLLTANFSSLTTATSCAKALPSGQFIIAEDCSSAVKFIRAFSDQSSQRRWTSTNLLYPLKLRYNTCTVEFRTLPGADEAVASFADALAAVDRVVRGCIQDGPGGGGDKHVGSEPSHSLDVWVLGALTPFLSLSTNMTSVNDS